MHEQVSSPTSPRTWIFQANPALFRLADAIKAISRFRWSVAQFIDQIKAGDRVYLWQSGANGGLMAAGRILTDPAEMVELPEELAFETEPDEKAKVRVELELTERYDPPVRREVFVQHPVLSNSTIIKIPRGTNFRLSESEAAAVVAIINPPPDFAMVMRRYNEDGTAFQSPERGAVYCVSATDESGCEIARLTANEPERCPYSQYDAKLALVRQSGGRFPFASLDGTAARRTAYLQGPDLGLTADRKEVVLLETPAAASKHFDSLLAGLKVDRSSGPPKLYKPALMACVIEAVLNGELRENRISFDWVLPRFLKRMEALGQAAGPQQAAYAFFNLTSEQFWLLAYHDPKQFILSSSDATPNVIQERVRFASLKETYWRPLSNTEACKSALRALTNEWWPTASSVSIADPLAVAFHEFRSKPAEQVRVRIRRERAAQLRALWADPDSVTLDQFTSEVWLFESSTRIDGEEFKGRLEGDLSAADVAVFSTALDQGRLELHGNYVWSPGSSVFGPSGDLSHDAKVASIRDALRIVHDPALSPAEKYGRIAELPGFGPGVATGLAMIAHPTECAVWNKQSQGAFEKLGLTSRPLETFQKEICLLRDRVGAADYLELDWFLYLINQDRIKVADMNPPNSPPRATDHRYWAIGLGEGARLWPQCRQEGIIAIGWDQLGDLRKYADRDAIASAIRGSDESRSWPMNDSLACHQFCHDLRAGDMVFVKQGRDRLLGIGVVESEYEYRPSRAEYHHVRRVRWENSGEWTVPIDARVPVKTLTEVTDYERFLAFALALRTATTTAPSAPERPPYTIDRALQGAFLPREEFVNMIGSLGRKKNAILQGPPGVGKTFLARRLAYHLVGYEDPEKVTMVQFHQSYSYEDFVQGWRPNDKGGFDRRDGAFFEFCGTAAADPTSSYVFVIDEINRGNLSKVFGELFMLLEADKRGPKYSIPLTYSRNKDERFHVPENLYVLGLMNTADRSLAMVDYALRRRFAFVDLRPMYDHPGFRDYMTEAGVESGVIDRVVDRMLKVNEAIRSDDTRLGPGFEVGHSFFCPQGNEDSLGLEWYRTVVRSEVAPLLREYWFDDSAKANKLIAGLLE